MSRRSEFPRVSCIIAVFNGEAYLHEAIDSLLAQQYPSVEIILVNDGSTDRTPSVIDQYGDRVRGANQDHCGVWTRNRGVELSSGRFLSFLDADDRLDSRKIAMQLAAFGADPQLDFCDCHTSFFWSAEISAERGSGIFATLHRSGGRRCRATSAGGSFAANCGTAWVGFPVHAVL